MKHLILLFCTSLFSVAPVGVYADDAAIAISADFPGGNVLVKQIDGLNVELAPDLRGGRDWFYWAFQATARQAGEVTFTFPPKVAGALNGAVGNHGPAISTDDGKTWSWMGTASAVTQGRSFRYRFTRAGESVRFAVTIPYLQRDLDAFIARNKGNPHLAVQGLTRSLKGRDVRLIQIGQPAEGARAVLMTGRHHACESMASFLLEGVMQAAIADTPEGADFRRRYVLYVVPLVDTDGVEDGDQGKWRKPHDHNRDYADSIYPEVKAIKALADAKAIRILLDFHCPMLTLPDHQVMYFAGPIEAPPQNHETVKQLAAAIKAQMPRGSPTGPLVWLKKSGADRAAHCSGYFSTRPGILMAATLEFPYAPPKAVMDPDSVRTYGAAVLRAWSAVKFADAAE